MAYLDKKGWQYGDRAKKEPKELEQHEKVGHLKRNMKAKASLQLVNVGRYQIKGHIFVTGRSWKTSLSIVKIGLGH